MKFKKRFLMCLAIVGILLVPSVAKAGDANALNKWMTELPGTGTLAVTSAEVSFRFLQTRGSGQSIKRNQKAYMAFYDTGDTVRVNQNGIVTACTEATDCASAPLFIASESAMICVDSDIGSATAVLGNTIRVSICADSTCTDATSIVHGGVLSEALNTLCGQGGAPSNSWVQSPIGGQWIYVELIGAPTAGDEVLVWVTGQ